MVLRAAPLPPEDSQAVTGLGQDYSGQDGFITRRISLSETSISGAGVSVVDLGGEGSRIAL